jgi:hypothetical protein
MVHAMLNFSGDIQSVVVTSLDLTFYFHASKDYGETYNENTIHRTGKLITIHCSKLSFHIALILTQNGQSIQNTPFKMLLN